MRSENIHQIPHSIHEVIISAERLRVPVDIAPLVTDVEFFESLDKTYIECTIVFLDNARIIEANHLVGGEQVNVVIKSLVDGNGDIEKTFKIQSIKTVKGKDSYQVGILNCVEDIAFESTASNVNKHYKGAPWKIVSNIAREYLDVEVSATKTEKGELNVIVPNKTPLAAINWITKTACSEDGFPLYTYRKLRSDRLHMNNLGEMLRGTSINANNPYSTSQVVISQEDSRKQSRTIISHKFGVGNYTQKLIDQASVGARYSVMNTADDVETFDWNLSSFQNSLIDGNIIKKDQRFRYSPTLADPTVRSRSMFSIGGSNPFRTTSEENFSLGYNERKNAADYKLYQTSQIMKNLLGMQPLTIVVDGLDFLNGAETIGNIVSIVFPRSAVDENTDALFDKSKSGEYFILKARHIFTKEGYHVSLLTSRMTGLK
jgi:hypothetical protein